MFKTMQMKCILYCIFSLSVGVLYIEGGKWGKREKGRGGEITY